MVMCALCGCETEETREIPIYEEATPESKLLEIKEICPDCFDEITCMWVGF